MAYYFSRLQAALQPNRQPTARTMSTHAMHANDLHRESSQTDSPRHTIMWIDGVGGYLLWDKPELVLGQAYFDSRADIGITGDLGRQAAAVRRLGADYLIQPLQATKLDGRTIDRPQLLRDGSLIELGNSVKLRFLRPSTLSGTARLEMVSIHHWKPTVDAVVLLADCCMIGPRAGSHIPCPQWQKELVLVQKAGMWHLRADEDMQVNGQIVQGQIPIASGTRVRGEDFSVSFE